MASKLATAAAVMGIFSAAVPHGSRLARERKRTGRIIEEITAVPGLAIGLKAKDLRERYSIHLSTAYQVLRRARRIQAQQPVPGLISGSAPR